MEEQNDKAEEKRAPENTNAGSVPSAAGIIEQANSRIKRMEEENARLERNIAMMREEQDRVVKGMFGGRADAGTQQAPKIETAKEYAEKVLRNQIKR